MNRLIEDLRFFIGAFFMIVGGLLVVQGAIGSERINWITGLVFMALSATPLVLAVRAARR